MLSETHLSEVGNFNTEAINQLRPALNGGIDAVSAAGACELTKLVTELSVDATKAYTLAAPTVAGQRKIVRCVAATNTPAGTLTVSSPDDTTGFVCPTTFFFDNVGQLLEFQATTALKWRCVRKHRVGQKTVVVGTTDLAGIADMCHINLSVTGTVQSTGTKGIPKGAAVGELLLVGCSTAALTPHGDIFATALISTLGAAGNTLDDFTATTDNLLLMWTGAAWQVIGNRSTAVTVTTV